MPCGASATPRITLALHPGLTSVTPPARGSTGRPNPITLLIHLVLAVAAREQVRHQVEDLVLLERVEQPVGIIETFDVSIVSTFLRLTLVRRVRVEHVGVDDDVVAVQVDDPAGDDLPSVVVDVARPRTGR